MDGKKKEKDFGELLEKIRELDYTGYSEQYPPFASWTDFSKSRKERIIRAWRKANGKVGKAGLFVNFPFCPRKCSFCFLPVTATGGKNERARRLAGEYLRCLGKEISFFSGIFKGVIFRSLYIGGGRPTLMNQKETNEFFRILKRGFSFATDAQTVIEMHPDDINSGSVETFRKNGVNRACLGVQSMDESVLAKVSRKQNMSAVKSAFKILSRAGIKTNIDLILGLPGQSERSFLKDLLEVLRMKPDQIHLNTFIVTPYTPYGMSGGKRPDYTALERVRKKGFAVLRKAGYVKIDSDSAGLTPESRNFQSTELWKKESLLGLGPGSISHAYGEMRYINHILWTEYRRALERGKIPCERGIKMNIRDEMIYYSVQKLTELGELDFEEFRKYFGSDFRKIFPSQFRKLSRASSEEELKKSVKSAGENWADIRKMFYLRKHMTAALRNMKLKNSFLGKFGNPPY